MKNFFKKCHTHILAYSLLLSISLSLSAMDKEPTKIYLDSPTYPQNEAIKNYWCLTQLVDQQNGLRVLKDEQCAWIACRAQALNKALLSKLTLKEGLDEFRDHGTIEGKKSSDVVSDSWAISIFKPSMNKLISRTVAVKKTGPIKQLYLSNLSPNSLLNISTYTPDWFDYAVCLEIKQTDGLGIWTMRESLWGKLINLERRFVDAAYFNHNNTQIVSTSMNKALIWTKQNNGSWVQTGGIEEDEIICARFSLDGTKIVTTSKNGTTRIWTQIDLVDTTHVAEKIMLLQLLNRDGKDIIVDRPHLQAILKTFDNQAFNYLVEEYKLPLSAIGSIKEYKLPLSVTGGIKARGSI